MRHCTLQDARPTELIGFDGDVDIALVLKKLTDRTGKSTIYFYKYCPFRAERPMTYICNGSIETKRIVIRHEKSQMRLVVEHMSTHLFSFALHDIGRIGDNEVYRPIRLETPIEYIIAKKTDIASLQIVGILLCNPQGIRADVDPYNPSFRQGQSQRDSNAPATGAKIKCTNG